MSEAWKNLDLEGDGLQAISLKLAQQMKQRKRAYGLLLLYPLGLHRAYLENPLGAWLYRAGFALALLGYFVLHRRCVGSAFIILLTAAAVYDVRWIDDRIAELNKALKLAAYRARPKTAPAGFRGRYTDDNLPENAENPLDDYLEVKAKERGGHVRPGEDVAYNSNKRVPSIAQQEALLKMLAQQKSTKPDNPQ